MAVRMQPVADTTAALRDATQETWQASTNLAEDTEAVFFSPGVFQPPRFLHFGSPAGGLFNVRPDGSPELSDTVRSIVD